jgi:hypothetical protein
MPAPIALKDITIHRVVEQPRCTDFGVMGFPGSHQRVAR